MCPQDRKEKKENSHIVVIVLGCKAATYTHTQRHLPGLLKTPSPCAGVGNANEGGKGRAGTKLFQDFQMLSRIWTHPWCLQLDYISKENKVRAEWGGHRP